MPGELVALLTRGSVPNPYGCVIAGGEPGAVGCDRYSMDRFAMPGELVALLTRGSVPNPYGCVIAGGEPGAVGCDRYSMDRFAMPGELVALLTRGSVPNPHGRIITAGGEPGAIGCDRHCRFGPRVAGQCATQSWVTKVRNWPLAYQCRSWPVLGYLAHLRTPVIVVLNSAIENVDSAVRGLGRAEEMRALAEQGAEPRRARCLESCQVGVRGCWPRLFESSSAPTASLTLPPPPSRSDQQPGSVR